MNCVPCPIERMKQKGFYVIRMNMLIGSTFYSQMNSVSQKTWLLREDLKIVLIFDEKGCPTNIVHLVNYENIMCFFERGYTHKNFNSFVFCIEFSFILWHDRSLQIKIITLSHKNRAVFPQLLL